VRSLRVGRIATLRLVRRVVEQIGPDESMLLLDGRVVLGVTTPGYFRVMVVVGPFGLEIVISMYVTTKGSGLNQGAGLREEDETKLTKWFANSKPGRFAFAYSKSMTTSCLCWFAGSKRGDSPSGTMRRMLPYWVCCVIVSACDASLCLKANLRRCERRPSAH
jgi:hypothetical protein